MEKLNLEMTVREAAVMQQIFDAALRGTGMQFAEAIVIFNARLSEQAKQLQQQAMQSAKPLPGKTNGSGEAEHITT